MAASSRLFRFGSFFQRFFQLLHMCISFSSHPFIGPVPFLRFLLLLRLLVLVLVVVALRLRLRLCESATVFFQYLTLHVASDPFPPSLLHFVCIHRKWSGSFRCYCWCCCHCCRRRCCCCCCRCCFYYFYCSSKLSVVEPLVALRSFRSLANNFFVENIDSCSLFTQRFPAERADTKRTSQWSEIACHTNLSAAACCHLCCGWFFMYFS